MSVINNPYYNHHARLYFEKMYHLEKCQDRRIYFSVSENNSDQSLETEHGVYFWIHAKNPKV